MLCYFADELGNIFPEALKGRIGGDEFVFYVEDMDRELIQDGTAYLLQSGRGDLGG